MFRHCAQDETGRLLAASTDSTRGSKTTFSYGEWNSGQILSWKTVVSTALIVQLDRCHRKGITSALVLLPILSAMLTFGISDYCTKCRILRVRTLRTRIFGPCLPSGHALFSPSNCNLQSTGNVAKANGQKTCMVKSQSDARQSSDRSIEL